MRSECAYEMLNGRSTPDALAAELNQMLAGSNLTRWTPERVKGAAAVHAHFETDQPRDGEHKGFRQLAADTGEPLAVIRRAALDGSLGPGRWIDGELQLAPTVEELHRALPNFALREAARAHGLEPGELIR
jgi:hypothetical protein